jgi:uncharacterized protein YdeI (YjbR/CyaY-like superfamily)
MARTDRRGTDSTAFRSEHEFREWLAKEHRRADGVVLRIYKKGSGVASYDSPANATLPPDFVQELDRNPKAKAFFASLSKANSYAIAYRLRTAKRPETKTKRMRLIIEMLSRGETFH